MIRSAGRFQQRRGAVLVFIALSMTFIMAMLAFVVEISRLMADSSELQSLTDASALAGAYGLQKVRNATYTTIADSTASLNKVEGGARTVTYKFGKWNGTTLDTSNAVTLATADAVQATATLTTTHFFGGFLGQTNAFSIKRSSVAWMGGSIDATSCLKPWALSIAAVKQDLGYPVGNTTPLTEADVRALDAGLANDTITVKNGPGDFSGAPGAFGAVDLGSGNGAKVYEDAIADQSCSQPLISIGDQVGAEPGNMAGPTRKGVCTLCNCGSGGQGDFACSPPVPVTIIIYSAVSGNGKNTTYTVGYFGVFNITGYHGQGSADQVVGTLSGMSAPGSGFTPVPGPVTKLVLVH